MSKVFPASNIFCGLDIRCCSLENFIAIIQHESDQNSHKGNLKTSYPFAMIFQLETILTSTPCQVPKTSRPIHDILLLTTSCLHGFRARLLFHLKHKAFFFPRSSAIPTRISIHAPCNPRRLCSGHQLGRSRRPIPRQQSFAPRRRT